MKTNTFSKFLSFILCAVLIAALVLVFPGCSDKDTTTQGTAETPATQAETEEKETESKVETVGSGSKTLHFTVKNGDEIKEFTVLTDEAIVGDALLKLNLIAGEDGDYGLYIKTVAGTTLDYNTDGKYWALYVGDAYATTGIDGLEATDGLKFSLVAES